MADDEALETYAFSADISQLMSLIINAFYSNKEIFLRELISNASDAMDKIKHEGIADPAKLAANPQMYANISVDRENRTVTCEDSGIGMTRDDLVNNLGTIAKSGTKAFMEYVSSGADITMIGQFGVGFYSAYLVSDKVRVVSKNTNDEQYIWESAAGGTFTVWKDETFEHGVLKRGTKVICYLKDDAQLEYLETDRLKELVLKHSAFVAFPVSINMETRKEDDVEGSEEKAVTVTHKWELINKNEPVWMRQPETVTQEEYAELYRFIANDWEDHLGVKHVIQTGQVLFKALLYCPRSAPKDMFDMGKMSHRFSIRLYVRRVFIKEFNDLIPKWMGFIKGIVDSDDMPLNISREKLQENAILKHIKVGLQKSAFLMFEDMAKDKETYKTFYEPFSQCLKLGVYEDSANRSRILPLLRYHSNKSGEALVSLDEYVQRMKPGQNYILYITGRSLRDASRSPYIEALKRDGYEIIYMVDPMDEYALQFMKEYQGKELMSCMNQHALSLIGGFRTDEEKQAEFKPLGKRLQAILSGKVGSVEFCNSFEPDTCARVKDGDILELNFKHGLLKELLKHSEGKDDLQELAGFLYQVAGLDGADREDPRREDACASCQALMATLGAGEQDNCRDDMPAFSSQAVAPVGETLVGDVRKAVSKNSALISCGKIVRVVKSDRSRRATISFVDEDAGTVDVMYSASPSGPEEEESLPVKAIKALLPFELDSRADEAARLKDKSTFFKAASAVKEEGNELFKLKDFDGASERYSTIIAAFAARARTHSQVLLVSEENGKPELKASTVMSADAEGVCELMNGAEVAAADVLPIFQELLPLQAAAYMNRARCEQSMSCHSEAAKDLTVVLGLWDNADKRMLEADLEMREAATKGLYTAQYLRAKSRLARGLLKQAGTDVKAALARKPPVPTQKQLRELNAQVQAALEVYRQLNGPLAKELAKVSIAIRGKTQF